MAMIEMAREMGKALQASEEYKALNAAKEANDADAALQDSIGKFNLKRIELNELMSASDKDEDKVADINKELQSVYQSIMANPNMVAFNQAKQAMDKVMNDISSILSMSLNGEDPETCQIPEGGCGGSCSSCSGC